MKYILIIFIVFIGASLAYKYIFAADLPPEFVAKVQQQQNPFTVPKDSAGLMWQRAKQFLHERRRLIAGGKMQQRDSVIYIPYANSYKKGNSLEIRISTKHNSVVFTCNWWYSNEIDEFSSKEIALFIQSGEGRYDSTFKNR